MIFELLVILIVAVIIYLIFNVSRNLWGALATAIVLVLVSTSVAVMGRYDDPFEILGFLVFTILLLIVFFYLVCTMSKEELRCMAARMMDD